MIALFSSISEYFIGYYSLNLKISEGGKKCGQLFSQQTSLVRTRLIALMFQIAPTLWYWFTKVLVKRVPHREWLSYNFLESWLTAQDMRLCITVINGAAKYCAFTYAMVNGQWAMGNDFFWNYLLFSSTVCTVANFQIKLVNL